MKAALAAPTGGFHTFKLAPAQSASRIVLDKKETAAEPRVRKLFGLPAKASGGSEVAGALPVRK